jgi:hypothetical protein
MRQVAITLDIDWAPDWMIDAAAAPLVEHRVKATWFVTHASAAVDRLRLHPELFELGLHPNCLPGSTHGATEDEALRHVRALAPEAVSMRTHGLYQTTAFLLKAARDYGVKVDASLLLPGVAWPGVVRLRYWGAELLRVPYCWEDGCELSAERPDWTLANPALCGEGRTVLAFHPWHIALNTPSYECYRQLREAAGNGLAQAELAARSWQGNGAGTFFQDLARALRGSGATVRELAGLAATPDLPNRGDPS